MIVFYKAPEWMALIGIMFILLAGITGKLFYNDFLFDSYGYRITFNLLSFLLPVTFVFAVLLVINHKKNKRIVASYRTNFKFSEKSVVLLLISMLFLVALYIWHIGYIPLLAGFSQEGMAHVNSSNKTFMFGGLGLLLSLYISAAYMTYNSQIPTYRKVIYFIFLISVSAIGAKRQGAMIILFIVIFSMIAEGKIRKVVFLLASFFPFFILMSVARGFEYYQVTQIFFSIYQYVILPILTFDVYTDLYPVSIINVEGFPVLFADLLPKKIYEAEFLYNEAALPWGPIFGFYGDLLIKVGWLGAVIYLSVIYCAFRYFFRRSATSASLRMLFILVSWSFFAANTYNLLFSLPYTLMPYLLVLFFEKINKVVYR